MLIVYRPCGATFSYETGRYEGLHPNVKSDYILCIGVHISEQGDRKLSTKSLEQTNIILAGRIHRCGGDTANSTPVFFKSKMPIVSRHEAVWLRRRRSCFTL